MITFIPTPIFTAIDADGDPYVGAKLYTFATGTTTPKTTYTDSGKGTANTNPIILNSIGQATVWIDAADGAYRFRLDDPDDVTLWTQDGIDAAGDELADLLAAQADIIFASAAATAARLAKGTARQVLQMNSGVTAPEWASSPQKVLTTQADLLYASAANVMARLAKGTARQGLQMNSSANAPEWGDSPQSLMGAQGDLLYASAANVLAKLALGSANHRLFVNAAANGVEWASGIKLGLFQRDTATASGTQAVTGVGFKPSHVIFIAAGGGALPAGAELSIGLDDGTNCGKVYYNHNVTAEAWGTHYGAVSSIDLIQGAGINYAGKITTLGADGFTITWTKTGAKTGLVNIMYLAFR